MHTSGIGMKACSTRATSPPLMSFLAVGDLVGSWASGGGDATDVDNGEDEILSQKFPF